MILDDDDDGGDDDDNDARAELYAVCARIFFTIHIDSNISTYLYILIYVRDT